MLEILQMRSRFWLLLPAAILYVSDVSLTLVGQPASYWAGEYQEVVEANPLVYPLLVQSPWLFTGVAAVWLLVLACVIVGWRHRAAGWVAVIVALAHAVGGAGWLTRLGPWGWVSAGLYLAGAAQMSSWCWRRYAQEVAENVELCAQLQQRDVSAAREP